MIKTGQLKTNGIGSALDEPPLITLARAGEADPFGEATNFLAARGLNPNQFIRVRGGAGFVGSVPVFFVTAAAPLSLAKAGSKKAPKKSGGKKGGAKAGSTTKKKAAKKAATSAKRGAKKGNAKKSGDGRTTAKSPAKKRANKKSGKG